MPRAAPLRSTILAATLAGCAGSTDAGSGGALGGGGAKINPPNLSCSIPIPWIEEGGASVDGIPSLSDPPLVAATHPDAGYLRRDDRVIGLLVDGQPIAVPLNILWHHEIVNLDLGGHRLAVTHCPLTGSSVTFTRSGAAFAAFGVSGLLFLNNLLMYDRNSEPSLWPQMSRGARCGPRTGTSLTTQPSVEMTWDGWRSLHPGTRVVSSRTGYPDRDYRTYPYDLYDEPWTPPFIPLPGGLDRRRPTKERVLGIPSGDSSGVAIPFGVLDSLGAAAVAHVTVNGEPVVVFWDGARRAAVAYHASAASGTLSFHAEDGAIRDRGTGSTWTIDGMAVAGPLAGSRLPPVAEAFVAYWFAWAVFYPHAELWLGPEAA